jgi:hypothetical protein
MAFKVLGHCIAEHLTARQITRAGKLLYLQVQVVRYRRRRMEYATGTQSRPSGGVGRGGYGGPAGPERILRSRPADRGWRPGSTGLTARSPGRDVENAEVQRDSMHFGFSWMLNRHTINAPSVQMTGISQYGKIRTHLSVLAQVQHVKSCLLIAAQQQRPNHQDLPTVPGNLQMTRSRLCGYRSGR